MVTREMIFNPHTQEGRPAIYLTGRSLDELALAEDDKIRPLREIIKRYAKDSLNMVVITFSFASGLDWGRIDVSNPADQKAIEAILRESKLNDLKPDEHEFSTVIRGITLLLVRSSAEGLKWANGQPMKFLVMIEFAEHKFPCVQNGNQTREQLMAIESLHLTSQNLAMRKSGNLLIVHGREGMIDDLLVSGLHHVRLSQPDKAEILAALPALRLAYPQAAFDNDLDDQSIANLVSGTPLRPLESAMRASHFSSRKITAKELTTGKEHSIIILSEETVSVLNTARVKDVKLQGRNIQVPFLAVQKFAQALKNGNPSMPANLIFVGAPGTAKTDLSLKIGSEADAPAFEMQSPKGSLVGETERKMRLMKQILSGFSPHIIFIDEITEMLPLQRSDFDGDSGASKSVTAGLLSILSDESRRGNSLLIGTTNCPWRIGAAMQSRFVFIPVLHPLGTDFPSILVETATRVSNISFDVQDPQIQKAAQIFYLKGANARHIRGAIAQASLLINPLTAEAILFAAKDFCGSSNQDSAIYADLWAIKVCSYRSFLPWSDDPASYPFPPHLQMIVDPLTGDIDHQELDKQIEKYEPKANV